MAVRDILYLLENNKSIYVLFTKFINSAGDRSFWDGWSSKAMFIKQNGKFTRKNVRIQQGETACIAMLVSKT